jgi:hypothetical protein
MAARGLVEKRGYIGLITIPKCTITAPRKGRGQEAVPRLQDAAQKRLMVPSIGDTTARCRFVRQSTLVLKDRTYGD